ncbi:MAG TPA: pitrilysin family protein [Vicinamibacterales bacterium]|nr:pitrilysin family protein [Vicinamibacterales bacterium]
MLRTKTFRFVFLLASVLVTTSATGPDTIVRPAKFDYTMTTLPNGLQVVFLEDHSTPIVHAALWYHVGSKDEKPGRTGFAHLFEHLMFKGSRNVKPDQHPSWITSVGGQANAFTDEDATVYWQTVPAQYLPLVLWLEADRMASLDVSEEKFHNEREVVQEERRMRFENQPFGRLPEIIFDKAFTTHPYKHQTIGSMEDLQKAPTSAVQEFHDTYYVPNNATLTLVGDFETRQAQALVEQYLGRVPKGKPVPRDIAKEPPQKSGTEFTVSEAWPLPAVVVSHHITYDGHPDAYPLHILAKILSDGDSSRIYRSLVYEKQIALAAFGEAKLIEHPNLFYAVAIVQPPNKPEAVLKVLQGELDRIKTEGVTAAELSRAKRQFARDYILGRDTVQQKALHLAHAVVIHNDIKTADGEFDLFQNVTVADVQRVAKAYFTSESRMLLTILPRAGSAGRPGVLPPGFELPREGGRR